MDMFYLVYLNRNKFFCKKGIKCCFRSTTQYSEYTVFPSNTDSIMPIADKAHNTEPFTAWSGISSWRLEFSVSHICMLCLLKISFMHFHNKHALYWTAWCQPVNNATNHRSMYSHKHTNIWTNIAKTMLQKNINQFFMKTFCMYSIIVHLFTLVPLNRWNIFFKSVFTTALVRIFFLSLYSTRMCTLTV